ncbi:MAG: hypothetical protein DCC67_17485 [Planctomycetota bacterium]|nr:MAG: hypothetical protein DCC67_17485 [Planctomycetota bacterium]
MPTLVGLGLLLAAPGGLRADDPLIGSQKSYRILTRHSVLTRTYAELEAPTTPFQVSGTFDFRIEPSPLAVFPPVFNAKFVAPDIWAAHPYQDFVLDVAEIFALEEITGVGQSRVFPYRPKLFHFKGVNSTRSSVELHALTLGPWFYLRGGVTPPVDSDSLLPEYELRALARRQPSGDVNGDGVVDGEDLRAWIAKPVRDGIEFLQWQHGFAEEPPSLESLDAELNAALGATTAAAPEPSGLVAGLLAASGLFFAARQARVQRLPG